MMPKLRVSVGIGVLVVVGLVAASAQSSRPATLDDLVVEVRGLRAELTQAASASMRMQLFVARLSLQEQRITSLSRQLTDVQRELADVTRLRESTAFQLKGAEKAPPADLPADQIKEYQEHMARVKATFVQHQQREQLLRNQEIEIAAMIATEQSRWQEFNGRLDDLERSLPSSSPR